MNEYFNKIQTLSNPTFQQIRRIADQCLSLTKLERDQIWEELDHGKKVLETDDECCQYLCSFGNMHEEKIHRAVEKIDKNILNNDFEIIDWGCGQGLATTVFFDFLNEKKYKGKAKKITLIEPSPLTSERAILHVNRYSQVAGPVTLLRKYIDDVTEEEIRSDGEIPVIHFFSNILDIPQIDLKDLSNKIKNTASNDNVIVSVGPIYANSYRLIRFYENYFNQAKPLYFEINESYYYYGTNSRCTFLAKVFALKHQFKEQLIPIEFYPAAQFYTGYALDPVFNYLKTYNKQNKAKLNSFEVSAPFDIGASVNDDIHPVLAVLNNIITRGLPTKASPFIEELFSELFDYTSKQIKYGTIAYITDKEIDTKSIIDWGQKQLDVKGKPIYDGLNLNQLQMIYSPIAISRIQKTILEALLTGKIDINKEKWIILAVENDVPCTAIAIEDLKHCFNNIAKLSKDFQNLDFPEIELQIISTKEFKDSPLHISGTVLIEPTISVQKKEYDLVLDISCFETPSINRETFSRFKAKNGCYFNIRSTKELSGERTIYTTDLIEYNGLVITDELGNHTDIEETKSYLRYFLQLIFRKEDFLPGQLPILDRALRNKGVIGLLPTGGGKSLTYQLAAMLQPGVTLIVDPLRSLMKDQYDGLINTGIDYCDYINSTQTAAEKKAAQDRMEQSKSLFVFLSPERLAIYEFRERLKNMYNMNIYFSYGVIDEVHCVSEWGHDFRFSYLHLGRNLYNYVQPKKGQISLFGLTATASFDVLADVERELSGSGKFPLDSEAIVRYENNDRIELQYKIERVDITFEEDNYFDRRGFLKADLLKKGFFEADLPNAVNLPTNTKYIQNFKQEYLRENINNIKTLIKELQSSSSIEKIKKGFKTRLNINHDFEVDIKIEMTDGFNKADNEYKEAAIIFCPHRGDNTDFEPTGISVIGNKNSLDAVVPDIGIFLGGDDEKGDSFKNLEKFRDNKQPLMIATKAFGMGIDKPNVRYTVNMNYSSSLESFVQEAGRAGRDRKIALSIILLSSYELARISEKCTIDKFPMGILKGKWFYKNDLIEILNQYNLQDVEIDTLTPQDDFVKFSCNKQLPNRTYIFYRGLCNVHKCNEYSTCDLSKVENKYRQFNAWYTRAEIDAYLEKNNLKVNKNKFVYQNADYNTVYHFYENSFKGELVENYSMQQILGIQKVKMFLGNDTEFKPNETRERQGFLSTLLTVQEDNEVVVFIKYVEDDTVKRVNKAYTRALNDDFSLKSLKLNRRDLEFPDAWINLRKVLIDIIGGFSPVTAVWNALQNVLKDFVVDKQIENIINKLREKPLTIGNDEKSKVIFNILDFLVEFLNNKSYSDLAKALYRMTCIGLIQDFTQDYSKSRFRIVAKRKLKKEYYSGLHEFLKRYYSENRANELIVEVKSFATDKLYDNDLENEIYQCLQFLTNFVYDKISVKRKRAMDDMRTFCMEGIDKEKDDSNWKDLNEELKDFIYYYFNSKYAKRDYYASNGKFYSLMVDYENEDFIDKDILIKYLQIIDEKVEEGVPIDNVKHLQGAVRLIRRSETDFSPALALLLAFTIAYLETNNNKNLENEMKNTYKEGMLGLAEKQENIYEFWKLFDKYNEIIKPLSGYIILEDVASEVILKINSEKYKNIKTKYLA